MARGALAKEQIFKTILETFEGSFMYNGGKEVRIPFDEEGKLVQIKVTLTAAKENVGPDGEVLTAAATAQEEDAPKSFPAPKTPVEPSEQEKKNVEDLLKSLGLN